LNTLAIVPARGGSKGIPLKNLRLAGGKALVDWVLEAIDDSEEISHAVLSSDDDTILGHAKGKTIPLVRPDELAGDEVPTEAVMEHAIRFAPAELIVLLQPTSPLVTALDIDRAVRLVRQEGYESAVSVIKTHHLEWVQGKNNAHALFTLSPRPRRQEMQQYTENGAIYVTTRAQWNKSHCRIGGRVALHEMDESTAYEVDTPLDLALVDFILGSPLAPRKLRPWLQAV
jgi:CMP-N,N'-diacetyllegionaminic acid synthase